MIEIGKNFLFGLASARQSSRGQKEKYKTLAQQEEEQAEQLRQNYEERMQYLFRTTAERMHLAQEAAREALAKRQALRAANGVNDSSASAAQDASTTQLSTRLETDKQQAQLQQAAAQEENSFKAKWQALLKTAAAYRRSARKSGRLGSLGRAISSLFR